MATKRKYNPKYLNYGFTCLIDKGIVKPQCVICNEVLSNESLKDNKLKRHLNTKHSQLSDKNWKFFEIREQNLKRQRLDSISNNFICTLKQATMASCVVAWHIAHSKKAHAIGENLVKPAAIDMVHIMCSDDVAKKLDIVPLSNDTVRRRIASISANIKEQLISSIKKGREFSLQIDESTDISDDAQLLVYVRYLGENTLEEEFLFCKALETTMRGEDMFSDSFMNKEGLEWRNCSSICSDGAPAMLGSCKGFTARVKEINPTVLISHCFVHGENLASRRLSAELGTVMQDVIHIVNFIKAKSLNSRLSEKLCEDFNAEYRHLLYFSDVRWLSRGKVLERFVTLRKEVKEFLINKKHSLAEKFADQKWLLFVAYLSDMFSQLNILNLSLQGPNIMLVDVSEKLIAFTAKLKLWKKKIATQKTASFPIFNQFLEDMEELCFDDVQIVIERHLTSLIQEFNLIIPKNANDLEWVRNPFAIDVDTLPESYQSIVGFQEEFIDIQCDNVLINYFKKETLGHFWTKVKHEKSIVGTHALKALLPFVTTCLCESGFSVLTHIKTKTRNCLQPENDMRLALSKIAPNFDKVVETIQSQGSH